MMKVVIEIDDYILDTEIDPDWVSVCRDELAESLINAIPLSDVLQEIWQKIENNMESITGKYDESTPTRNLPSYKIERNEGRKECIKLIDSKIKELTNDR